MEVSQEIVLKSLEKFGVSIPESVSCFEDLTWTALVSICSQSLNLLEHKGYLFPVSLPDPLSVPDNMKICDQIALAFKHLGYRGELDGYKFLYPTEEESYGLLRFLVEMLSESSEGINGRNEISSEWKKEEVNSKKMSMDSTRKTDNDGVDLNLQKVEAILKDLRLKAELPGSSYSLSQDASFPEDKSSVVEENFIKDELFHEISGSHSAAETEHSAISPSSDPADQKDDKPSLACKQLQEQHITMGYEAQNLWKQEKELKEEINAKTVELRHIEEELKWLKLAVEKAFDEKLPIDYHLEQLSGQVDAQKQKIMELESKWYSFASPLEERKRSLMESLYADVPEGQERLQKLEELEQETQSIISEIKQREEEYSKLSADLQKQPKVASRRSHVDRIKEITKNSRKLDSDIEQILRETRELQLESNSIQERLGRTHAVLDEIVFREAKRDPVGRQAYRLLTSIHESFDQISEKIIATDRIRREVAKYEKKLAAISSRSLNVDKLRADLDSIQKEDEFIEQLLQD